MGKTIKDSLARSLGGNVNLNRKSLQMKRSWDEVSKLLQAVTIKKKK